MSQELANKDFMEPLIKKEFKRGTVLKNPKTLTIQGYVRNSKNNKPLGNIEVRLNKNVFRRHNCYAEELSSCITSQSGSYNIFIDEDIMKTLDAPLELELSFFQGNHFLELNDRIIISLDYDNQEKINRNVDLEICGSVIGTLRRKNGKAAAGCVVELYNEKTKKVLGMAVTDIHGEYEIPILSVFRIKEKELGSDSDVSTEIIKEKRSLDIGLPGPETGFKPEVTPKIIEEERSLDIGLPKPETGFKPEVTPEIIEEERSLDIGLPKPETGFKPEVTPEITEEERRLDIVLPELEIGFKSRVTSEIIEKEPNKNFAPNNRNYERF